MTFQRVIHQIGSKGRSSEKPTVEKASNEKLSSDDKPSNGSSAGHPGQRSKSVVEPIAPVALRELEEASNAAQRRASMNAIGEADGELVLMEDRPYDVGKGVLAIGAQVPESCMGRGMYVRENSSN